MCTHQIGPSNRCREAVSIHNPAKRVFSPFDYLSITKWKQQTPVPRPPPSDNHSFPQSPSLFILQYQLCKGSDKPAGSRQKVLALGRCCASSCFQPLYPPTKMITHLIFSMINRIKKKWQSPVALTHTLTFTIINT